MSEKKRIPRITEAFLVKHKDIIIKGIANNTPVHKNPEATIMVDKAINELGFSQASHRGNVWESIIGKHYRRLLKGPKQKKRYIK